MAVWNHRVMWHKNKRGDRWCDIREVYYGKDNKTIEGWVGGAASPYGDTAEELREEVAMFTAALEAPALNEWELPGYDETNEKEPGLTLTNEGEL